jgi:peptidoglycan/LPS O-acetylase OafA/YrhL
MRYFMAYPFATLSSIALYAILLALLIPRSRRILGPYLVHPIPPHQRYLNAFDTVRGVAAAWVALGHCWWATYPLFSATQLFFPPIAYNTKAVPMFAVLSGFLIYRSVLSIDSLDGLRSYAFRRFFRIYPVYLLGVLLCAVMGQYVSGNGYTGLGFFVSDIFMFYIANWPAGFGNPPTWSLFVECTFYAFLPLAVLVLRRQRMMIVSIVIIVAMLVADYPSRVFGLWKYFFFGVIASELSPLIGRAAPALFTLGIGLLIVDLRGTPYDWFANLFPFTVRHMDGESVGLGVAFTLILMSLPHLQSIGHSLNVLPLRVLGVISYSVYVTHFIYILVIFPEIGLFGNAGQPVMLAHFKAMPPMPAWYMPLLFFPGALFWGLVSFLLVERPGIKLGRWLANPDRAAFLNRFRGTVPTGTLQQQDRPSN